MRKLLILFLSIAFYSGLAQDNEATQLSYRDIVANNTLSPARVANALTSIIKGKPNYMEASNTSGTNTYTATSTSSITSYTAGLGVTIHFVTGNTAAVTVNINSLGAKSVLTNSGVALASGDIPNDSYFDLVYNGTAFKIKGAISSGGGSGTVSDFTAGNLSPLFTTSVATSTTTPALTFSLTSQSQNFIFAGPTSGSGAPTFRALVAGDLPTLAYWPLSGSATFTGNVSLDGARNILIGQSTPVSSWIVTGVDVELASATQSFALSATGAKLNLGSDATGDFSYRNSSGFLVPRHIGSTGDVLTTVGGLPVWAPPATGGTVTSVTSANGDATVATTTTTPVITIVSAPKWSVSRTLSITGDLAYTSPSIDGSGNVTAAGTLATVNSNVGSFGSATQVSTFTVNGKGLITAASNVTITPAASSITGAAALTKTDDTNVTVTLGGSPTTALLSATSLTLGWTGQLSLTRGGTNANLTASNGGVFYSTSSAGAILSGTATANKMLLSGSSAAPTWSTSTIPTSSGTSGNLLTSDGTNWLSSAPTFWNTSGATSITTPTITGTPIFTSNANETIFNGAWTASANSQRHLYINPTITMRSTTNDNASGVYIAPNIIPKGTTQDAVGVIINPILNVKGGVATITTLSSNTTAGCTNGTTTNFTGYTYTNMDGTGATGSGAQFTVVIAANGVSTITMTTAGSGYRPGDRFVFSGSSFGGSGTVTTFVYTLDTALNSSAASLRIVHNNYYPANTVTSGLNKWIDFQQNVAGTLTSFAYLGYYNSGSSSTTVAFGDSFGEIFNVNAGVMNMTRGLTVNAALISAVSTTTKEITYNGTNSSSGSNLSALQSLVSQRFAVANQRFGAVYTANTVGTGVPATGSITNAGSGYTNGTFGATVMTGGSGSGLTASITVAGGVVTVVTLSANSAINYRVGDVLSASLAGGSGFQYTLATIDFNGGVNFTIRNSNTYTDNGGAATMKNLTVYDDRTVTQNGTAGTPYIATLEQNITVSSGTPNLYGILIRNAISNSGFGLGATNPSATLHVLGTIKLDGNVTLPTAGNKLTIKEGTNGSVGQTTLVAGTKAITISGVTTSTRAFPGFVAPGGTVTTTWKYKLVCTANTLTITAIDNSGAINTLDTSTLNYFIIEPAP